MTVSAMEHQVVSADGTTIGFSRMGEGPPVVLVHGGLGSQASWRGVAECLADRYETYLVDRRGRGSSDAGTAPHCMEREVEDVQAILEVAGSGAIVVGHSFGGALVLEAARLAAPGEVDNVVVYEPAIAVGPHFTKAGVERLEALVRRGDMDGVLVDGLHQMVAAGGISIAELDAALAGRDSAKWKEMASLAWTFSREIRAAAEANWQPARFGVLQVPTLVITGELSEPLHHRNCEGLTSALPNAQLTRLSGQGHLAHVADPGALGRAIGDFLQQTKASK